LAALTIWITCGSLVMRRAMLPTTPSSVAENSMVWRAIRGRGDDLFDVVDEAHVEHAVGFVQHQDFQLREVDLARLHVVDQAARGRDQDFRILGQQLHLLRVRHAAQDRHGADAAHEGGVFARWVVTCRASSRVGVSTSIFGWAALKRTLAARTGGLRFLIWGRPAGGRVDLDELVQGRQHECCGLARTGLRRNQQVAACDRCRDGLLLHWGRRGVAGFGHCFDEGRV
jgi:hypothetical protein